MRLIRPISLMRPIRLIRSKALLISKKLLIALLATLIIGIPLLYLTVLNSKQASAAWYDDNWAYRKAVTVTVSSSSSDITNLETLITVDTTAITDKLQTNCEDLRFTNANGDLLPYYIDSCSDNSATNKIWVLADLVPKNTTTYTMYMYYGNPTTVAGSDSNKFNLFNGLVGYWTTNESSWTNDCSTGTVKDSSVNGNNGKSCPATTGPAGGATGKFGNAGSFDGSNDLVAIPNITSATGNYVSRTAWVYTSSVPSDQVWINGQSGRNQLVIESSGKMAMNAHLTDTFYSVADPNQIPTNQWVYYVGTLSSDGTNTTLSLYKNGVQVASQTFAKAVSSNNNCQNWVGGVNESGGGCAYTGQFFSGTIDEVRIYNRALSATEVSQLYTNPGTIATTATGTSLPSTSFASEEKAPGPIAYWKFDEGTGTNAQDSTSNNLDGTLNNTPSWQTEDFCITGKCLYFDGTNNENVSKSDDAKLDFAAADNFTVSAWVKRPQASSANNFIITKAQSGYTGYKLYQDTSGDYCFDVSDGTNTDTACTSAVEFDDSQWHLVQGVKSGTTSITLYVDGKQRAQDASIAATGTLANTGTFYIGVDLDGTSNEWLGFIDEVKVYRDNTARSAAQILTDYNSRGSVKGTSALLGGGRTDSPEVGGLSQGLVGYWKMDESSWATDCSTASVIDSSGNGNNGKPCPNASAATLTTGKFGNAGSFDGNDDYVNAGNAASLQIANDITVAAWIKIPTTTPEFSGIAEKYGDDNTGFILGVNNNNRLRLDIGYATSYLNVQGTTNLEQNKWFHVVGIKKRDEAAKVYVDGILEGTTGTATNNLIADTNINLSIGRDRWGGARTLNGIIDDVRIYNRALSPAEITALYNFAPGPRVYLKIDEGSGTSANDSSGNTRTGTINGNPLWVPGKYGKGLKMDGTGDDIQVSDF